MTRRELIENTAAFYNSNNWSAIEGPQSWECKYLTEEGKSCAVGRWMTPEAQERFKAPYTGGVTDVITVLSKEVTTHYIYELSPEKRSEVFDNVLIEEAWGHPYAFWIELQAFHDNDLHWSNDGINHYGIRQKEILLEKWGEKDEIIP